MKKPKKMVMKTIILTILVAFSSCKSAPTIPNQVRRLWSTKFNTCYCQWYSLVEVKNITKYVPCEEFYEKNFPDIPPRTNYEHCRNLTGFPASIWAKKITPWGIKLKQYLEDQNRVFIQK